MSEFGKCISSSSKIIKSEEQVEERGRKTSSKQVAHSIQRNDCSGLIDRAIKSEHHQIESQDTKQK